jgi:ubiquinone/menaquinone biosynthesis C-methylase UbiE
MSSLDYDKLANTYDQQRALSEEKELLWINLLKKYLVLDERSRVLDIGCGTGRFAIAIRKHLQCTVVGIDLSSAMLAKAEGKRIDGITWVQGRAEALPFSKGSVDACFASQVVHHFDNKHQAFAEIHRVLCDSGRVGIRYSSHADLRASPDYRFFPTALSMDLGRMPDTPQIKSILQKVGFGSLEEQAVRQQFFESSRDYLDKMKNKYASVLSLISEEEYQKGLRTAIAYFQTHEMQENEKSAEMTFLIGIR